MFPYRKIKTASSKKRNKTILDPTHVDPLQQALLRLIADRSERGSALHAHRHHLFVVHLHPSSRLTCRLHRLVELLSHHIKGQQEQHKIPRKMKNESGDPTPNLLGFQHNLLGLKLKA